MFAMFNQVFTMIRVLFAAAEKGATALDHVATIAEEKAKAYRDEERIKIKAKLDAMQKQADAGQLAIAE